MTAQVTDVLEAVQSFVAKGYDREYRVKDGNLVDLELGSMLDPCSIRVDAALRLESGDGAEDASNIYAITDPATERKGLLIDAFDVFDEICHRDLSERLLEHRETAPAGDEDVPSKHGLLVDNVTVSLHRSGMAQFVRFANGGQHGLQHQAQRQHGQKSHARECVRECRATGHEAPRYRHP